MGDEGVDPCECIFGYDQLAMRRLLNLLRNSQALCNDNECFEDSPPQNQSCDPNVLLMTVFFMVSLFLVYFRPRAQRIFGDSSKPSNNNRNDGSGAPPSPPPGTF